MLGERVYLTLTKTHRPYIFVQFFTTQHCNLSPKIMVKSSILGLLDWDGGQVGGSIRAFGMGGIGKQLWLLIVYCVDCQDQSSSKRYALANYYYYQMDFHSNAFFLEIQLQTTLLILMY